MSINSRRDESVRRIHHWRENGFGLTVLLILHAYGVTLPHVFSDHPDAHGMMGCLIRIITASGGSLTGGN